MMLDEPTEQDWVLADELWERLEGVHRETARLLLTALIVSSPDQIKAALKFLDYGGH